MRVYAEVKVLDSNKQAFETNEGEKVEYHENTMTGEGGVITMNSKADFGACVGKSGVAEIEARKIEGEKGYKLTLKKFTEGGVVADEAKEDPAIAF